MCIVGVAVVGRADGHDCLECRRAACRNLKCIEAAPGDAHHSDYATAPGLRCQPRNHLHAIVLLLSCVLVEQQAIRLATTSNIDANARVAVAGQIRMRQRVALVSPVALAIWEILQDRGNWVLFGIIGQPDARRQRRAVFQQDQRLLDHAHRARERRHNHRGPHWHDYKTAEVVNRYTLPGHRRRCPTSLPCVDPGPCASTRRCARSSLSIRFRAADQRSLRAVAPFTSPSCDIPCEWFSRAMSLQRERVAPGLVEA